MKILWIVNNINQVGGIERVVIGLANYFIEKGHCVTIASINTDKNDLNFLINKKVVIKHYKLLSIIKLIIEQRHISSYSTW